MDDSPIQVLLIDDHQTVLWGLQQLIDSQRPIMTVAGTASVPEDGIRLAQTLQPDVIVLDMDLGTRDATDIIPELLDCYAGKILILTGVRDETRTDRAILKGARGVVRKEAPADVVLKAIDSVHRGELWLDRAAIARVFRHEQERQQLRKAEAGKHVLLTPKEREIVKNTVQYSGVTNRELAKLMFMSEHTLRNHLSSIYQKLGVDNRVKLYVYAMQNHLA